MRAFRTRIAAPILRRPVRYYSASHATFRYDVDPASASASKVPGPWTAAKGAPSALNWDLASSGLAFSATNEKPDHWGNVLPEYFGADGHRDANLAYSELEKDETKFVGRLTDTIVRKGFVFVTGVPADTAQPTEDLLRKIAFIRETHYGGFYDFIPDLALADTAYTNVALAAHTDTTYFTDPVGLQSFHLLSHTDSSAHKDDAGNLGGQSLLVDGFHAAQILKAEEPHLFNVLASVDLPWHASGNEGITIAPDRLYPVLELDEKRQAVLRIRWNNSDRGVVPVGGEYSASEWYKAARKWDEILRRKGMEYWFQLKPGTVLIFDNRRVLHGRSAFTGVRRICGGYLNWDDYISRWRNTNYSQDEILKQIIG
ncbi:trimethyllysine dioxygenase [Xylariaceae sp. FL0594]|nr:trimethyllysine dioxygenase [Xylariaceae sp. FL0594]